jgi:hypothetical protein
MLQCVSCTYYEISFFFANNDDLICHKRRRVAEHITHTHTHTHSVQEHRPPGSVEQPIFDENPGSNGSPSNLWDACEVIAYFALEVRMQPTGLGLLGGTFSQIVRLIGL